MDAVTDGAAMQNVERRNTHPRWVPRLGHHNNWRGAMSTHEELRAALRTAASALKEHGPGFALAGSYAIWVAGGPEPVHDVDFVVAEADTEAAATTLCKAGFRIERPPEDWLFKAHSDGVLVDVLHRLNGVPVTA